MNGTNEMTIDALIEDLRNTPHAVGLALLRERLLTIYDITKRSIKKNPDDWVNPIFPSGLYLDLCKRIDEHLAFNQ